MKRISPFLIVISSLFFAACGKEKVVFEKNYDLKNEQWTYADTLNFDFDIADTMAIYDLVLNVKHGSNYPMQNIYTNIYTQFPSGERIKQLLNVNLADNTGKWEGNCSGNTCNFEVKIQENAFFNALGKHIITIEQFMRVEALVGVKSVSLKVVDKGVKRNLSKKN